MARDPHRGLVVEAKLVRPRKTPAPSFSIDVQLEAGPGVTVLFGPSGSGKSTTLAIIAGLVRPDSGRITCNGRTLLDAGIDVPPHRRRIALVFQSIALFPHMTVLDNVAYGIGRAHASRTERALGWLERAHVAHLASRSPATLSGGEAQRVALARALASEPDVLLLDEPFSSLDADLRDDLACELRRLVTDLSLPTVLVTHDRDDAHALGDSAVLLRDGRVVAAGTPSEVIDRRDRAARAPPRGAS